MVDRKIWYLIGSVSLLPIVAGLYMIFSPSPPPAQPFYSFTARDILDQNDIDFTQFRGKVVLVANVASYCSLTQSNYKGLAALLDKYYVQGLRVLLFPCNQFGAQEPDTPTKIKSFAETFSKKFILAQRVEVNGSNTHPLWKWLKPRAGGWFSNAIKWNFTKFLIDKNGVPSIRYSPHDTPEKMESTIESMLKMQ
jgi:glutathione peroxidase-family protein